MPFLLFLACASEDALLPSANAPLRTPSVGLPPTPSAAEPPALTVTFTGAVDGFIELVHYDLVDGEPQWDATPLSRTAIDRETMVVPLPDVPPGVERGGSVAHSYAIALRSADGEGEPSIYTGLASFDLVYAPADFGDAAPGWNLASPYGEAGVRWRALTDGVTLGEDLVGHGAGNLSGAVALQAGSETRIALATLDEASVADTALVDGWSIALTNEPDASLLGSDEGLLGAIFYFNAYDDLDGDEARTTEPLLGEGCIGAEPVAVTWFGWAETIGQAKQLDERGFRSGWDVVKQVDDGLVPVPDGERGALVLATSCG